MDEMPESVITVIGEYIERTWKHMDSCLFEMPGHKYSVKIGLRYGANGVITPPSRATCAILARNAAIPPASD